MNKLIIICLLFYCVNLNAQIQNENSVKLESLIKDCEAKDIFSGTILAAYDGEIIFQKSVGFSNREKNILNRSNTKYNIGSIGKMFSAIMVLQLAEENKISLDDKVSVYLPEFSSKVSIRQLLNHTSGYSDYLRNPEYQSNKEKYKNINELLKLISTEELLFEPGEKFSYSNSGYVILGGLTEFITKESYENNLKKRILEPLGMNNSGFIKWDDDDPDKATGYIQDIKGNFRDNRNLRLQPSPAGGMYSTAEDLLKLDRSLIQDNKLLKDESKVQLFAGFKADSRLTFSELKNNPSAENAEAGGAPGINALMLQFPGKKYTVIILSNYDLAAEAIERQVTDIINGKDYVNPKLPPGRVLYKTFMEKGTEYVENNFDLIIKEGGYEINDDRILNNIGYQFLNNDMTDESIIIFRKNAEMFGDVVNCFDSLGEAYLKKGDRKNAMQNYEKVLAMDPENENAKRILEKLKSN